MAIHIAWIATIAGDDEVEVGLAVDATGPRVDERAQPQTHREEEQQRARGTGR